MKKGDDEKSKFGGIQRRTIATWKTLRIKILTHHRPLRALHPKPMVSDPVTASLSCSSTITVSKRHSLSLPATECSLGV